MPRMLAANDGFDAGASTEPERTAAARKGSWFDFVDGLKPMTDTISARPAIRPTAVVARPGA
jgi:hypothetical protein